MFRPRIGQQLLMAIALGLILLPAVSRATTVTIPKPHDSTQNIASTSVVNTISIAHTGTVPGATYQGTLDLQNNDLVVQGSSTTDAQTKYATVNDMVQSGFSPSGDWSGTGITSTFANIDFNNGLGATGIGVILNDDAQDVNNPSGSPIVTTWDGKTVNALSVLTKYTFVGDTQLRGKITGFDVGTVLGSFNTPGVSGWINGDFFNQGIVTGTDVGVVLSNFSAQNSYPLTVTFASASALSVPEPSTLIMAAFAAGAIGLFARAKRRTRAASN